MGFGFNLFCMFILLPTTAILLIVWAITRKKIVGIILGIIWGGIIGLCILSGILQIVFAKKVLKKSDYYGQYIINRKYFKGKQADWQYNNFRFEIRDNDSIYFHLTNRETIVKTYKGVIRTKAQYESQILSIFMGQKTHHILTEQPTIYRDTWSFYLVFYSPKFGNVFFTKGQWKPL